MKKHTEELVKNSDKHYVDERLTECMFNHAKSFSVVEKACFQSFGAILRPEYSVPTCNYGGQSAVVLTGPEELRTNLTEARSGKETIWPHNWHGEVGCKAQLHCRHYPLQRF